ncbi:hypothetical protein ACFFTK_04620 [Pseudonocardia petroleophila]|uniref:Lipoprotein LprG n=1 Tax=Pseudonocardia petroleophila TaxID=37331 RepID=A0A7G7MPS8_9PSEU|nr:hypothetical protein [Pseudonocardia petroleophila]QNG54789.1 hypothetical protein H6H00_13435 [Pseudonocardia petroleophila]
MASWISRLLALLLVAGALAGCSGAEPAPATLTRYYDINELIAAVSAQQRVDRTARFSLRGELVGAADARLRFTGAGEIRISDADLELAFTQVVTQPGADPQVTGFVVLPDAVYLRMPADSGDDRPWVRVDPASSDPGAQQLIAQADQLTERADLTVTLARYADATLISDAVDDVIGGDPAVRYTIVTDLARAAETAADPAVRAQLEQQVRAGLTRITSTLWVDAAHRPLRSAARQELPGIGTLAITSSYRDWGQAATIAPPPEAQVR